MKFEEQFPSLIKKDRDKNCNGEWMDWFYVGLITEGGMDDGSGNAKRIDEVDYVTIEAVKEHCLDKKKVREAFKKAIEDATVCCNGKQRLIDLEKELELI